MRVASPKVDESCMVPWHLTQLGLGLPFLHKHAWFGLSTGQLAQPLPPVFTWWAISGRIIHLAGVFEEHRFCHKLWLLCVFHKCHQGQFC